MPFSLPTLPDLRGQDRANFAARLLGADQTARRSMLNITADVIAGGIFAGLRALGWLSRQIFIDSAEAPYLDRLGANYGMVRIAATAAAGSATFSGVSGTVIPSGTQVQSSDGTQFYETIAPGTISGGGSGTVVIVLQASVAGSAGNQSASAPLQLAQAIAGVQPIAVVTSGGLTGGADLESDAGFRARVQARIQQPPQGGAAIDFWQWARASGIPTRAWVFPLNRGAGTCDVSFMIDTRIDPVPLSADLANVLNYIQARAPVVGDFETFALVQDAQSVTIHGLNPGDSTTQSEVTAALLALYASVPPGGATFGDGVTQPLQNALFPILTSGTLDLSQIEAAIESVGTIISYDLVSPSGDVTFAKGHLPGPPTVAYT